MQRIIVGVDDERSTDAAVRWVIERAKETASSIHLVTCFDVLLMMDRTSEEQRLETLKDQIESAVPTGVVTTATIEGPIPLSLVAAADGADLLVVGFRRSHPVLTALAGSTAARVAAACTCATVIVPEDWQPGRRGGVVVGLGADESDTAALDFAVREARHPHRELVVVHAWRVPAVGWDAVAALVVSDPKAHELHQKFVAERVAPIRREYPNLQVREDTFEGHAAEALLAHVPHAECFVIGTHGHGPITGLLLGSTAHGLLPRSPVPVCVVPLGALVGPAGGQLVLASESSAHAG